jgi:hypothetical protein
MHQPRRTVSIGSNSSSHPEEQEVTMTPALQHAREVIAKMRNLRAQANEIMELHAGKTRFNRLEKDELQQRFRSLKEELKRYAKTGTIDGEKRSRSEYEEYYFEPAVSAAAANILVSVNADPARPEWFSCIYGIQGDVGHLLSQLEEQFLIKPEQQTVRGAGDSQQIASRLADPAPPATAGRWCW